MAKTSFLPRSRPRRRPSIRRLASSIAASASDRDASLWLVIGFALIHAMLWTLILMRLKAGQDVHFDVAETYAWGQKFLLGYGKHPPLSGWVAGVWFKLFPAADWATYALAMATVGCGLILCWLVALRVVDRRRAFFTVVMLAIYPIFNFKGYKYNPDLLQLVTLPLVVLAYLNAFEKRTARSGLWLGLAGALALMTKYWVLTMFGAIGIAALLHPDRLRFLRSPAPWRASCRRDWPRPSTPRTAPTIRRCSSPPGTRSPPSSSPRSARWWAPGCCGSDRYRTTLLPARCYGTNASAQAGTMAGTL